MCKVIIDAFDNEEQAVAFVDWFKRILDKEQCQLATTEGLQKVSWDGIDERSSSFKQKVVNITTFSAE